MPAILPDMLILALKILGVIMGFAAAAFFFVAAVLIVWFKREPPEKYSGDGEWDDLS